MRVPASEAAAYRLLELVRWDGSPSGCPHCGASGRCYFLRPADGGARRTRSGGRSARRVWKCGACRRQFSVLTGTIFEGTRIPLRSWLAVIDGRSSGLSREGARHVERRLAAACEVLPARSQRDGLLRALLAMPAAEAARIRERTPGRLRPRRQVGPRAEYG